MSSHQARAAVARAFRSEYGRTVAIVMRSLRDLEAAEDAVQEAFAAAAATWPRDGVLPNPQAWIVTAARRRALDRLRRDATAARVAPAPISPGSTGGEDSPEIDDELRLILLCAHPALAPESQVALTLRFVGGLTAAEIARAFGTSEATMAQRLSRAKAKIREASIDARLPDPARWRDRVDAALAVIYAIFNEGYVATSGDLSRGELAHEAVRLACHLHRLAPHDPEAAGLLALLLLIHARNGARITADGELVALADQDRTLWDAALIREGQALVRGCLARNEPGPYQVQAAIQAVHSDAATDDDTDWSQVLRLNDQLLLWVDTPAVRTARAVALGKVNGPTAGLAVLSDLPVDQYVLAVRATLYAEMGDHASAHALFEQAANHTTNEAERAHLLHRAGYYDNRIT